jgi:hypothetical protein
METANCVRQNDEQPVFNVNPNPGRFDSLRDAEAVQPETGFFAMEKKGIKNGVSGGLIMMTIAVVWFVVGYSFGWVFYYPPILFLIGVYAFFKGLFTGNINGKKAVV